MLRGHCRLINWLNFNTAGSQGIGRPKEEERDKATASQWSSQNTHNVLIVRYPWSPKTIIIVPLKIIDHHNKYNNHEKV